MVSMISRNVKASTVLPPFRATSGRVAGEGSARMVEGSPGRRESAMGPGGHLAECVRNADLHHNVGAVRRAHAVANESRQVSRSADSDVHWSAEVAQATVA